MRGPNDLFKSKHLSTENRDAGVVFPANRSHEDRSLRLRTDWKSLAGARDHDPLDTEKVARTQPVGA